jgi:hypothetical protein
LSGAAAERIRDKHRMEVDLSMASSTLWQVLGQKWASIISLSYRFVLSVTD